MDGCVHVFFCVCVCVEDGWMDVCMYTVPLIIWRRSDPYPVTEKNTTLDPRRHLINSVDSIPDLDLAVFGSKWPLFQCKMAQHGKFYIVEIGNFRAPSANELSLPRFPTPWKILLSLVTANYLTPNS